jgi:hypothetical protein
VPGASYSACIWSGAGANCVTTPMGTVLGVLGAQNPSTRQFLGIPYAQPPQRWQPPKPATPWAGLHNGTRYGKNCVAHVSSRGAGGGGVGAEDCLLLNVHAPLADCSNCTVSFTELAQDTRTRLGPVVCLRIPIRRLNSAHDLGQPCAISVGQPNNGFPVLVWFHGSCSRGWPSHFHAPLYVLYGSRITNEIKCMEVAVARSGIKKTSF